MLTEEMDTCSMTSLSLHCGPINVAAVMILACRTPSAQSYRPATSALPLAMHILSSQQYPANYFTITVTHFNWMQLTYLQISNYTVICKYVSCIQLKCVTVTVK